MSRTRILLVDDDATCRDALRAIFEHASDFSVIGEASDSNEGLRVAALLCPDVIVVDVQMPDVDGIAIARAFHGDCQKPAVICLSVYPTRHDEACAAGVASYLLKDSPAPILVEAVRAAAARRIAIRDSNARRAVPASGTEPLLGPQLS